MVKWTDERGNQWCDANSVDEFLHLIWAIGVDYDGNEGSLIGMEALVNKIVEMAQKARNCLYEGKLWAKDSMGGERPDNWKEVYE